MSYVFTKQPNPTVLPSAALRPMAFTPDGSWIIGWGTTGVPQTYQRQLDGSYQKVVVSGQITTLTTIRDAHFNFDGTKIVVASQGGTASFAVYSFNLNTGLLTAETITSVPTAITYSCWFHPTLNYVVIGYTGTTGGIQIWKLSAGAWAKVAEDNVTFTSGNMTFVGWSSDGLRIIARGTSGTPLTQCWTFNTSTDVLTIFSGTGFDTAPAGATSGQNGQGAVLPNGDLILCIAAAPGITWYQWVSGNNRYEKKTVPTGLGVANGQGVGFSSDSAHVVVSYPLTPFTVHYEISGSTMTQSANQIPTTDFPSGQPWNPRFSQNATADTLVAGLSVSPFIATWVYREFLSTGMVGFKPTTEADVTMSTGVQLTIGMVGFLPTTQVLETDAKLITSAMVGFKPTTQVLESNNKAITSAMVGFLPKTLVNAKAVTSFAAGMVGFKPTTQAVIDVGLHVTVGMVGFLPKAQANIQMSNNVSASMVGFLPKTQAIIDVGIHVIAGMKGFLPTTQANVDVLIERTAIAMVGFLPTTVAQVKLSNAIVSGMKGFLPTTQANVTIVDHDVITVLSGMHGFLSKTTARITERVVISSGMQGFLPQSSTFVQIGQPDPDQPGMLRLAVDEPCEPNDAAPLPDNDPPVATDDERAQLQVVANPACGRRPTTCS